MKKFFLLLLSLGLAACSRHPATTLPETEAAPWEKMIALSTQPERPSRVQFSLRFGQEGNTRRVNCVLWSNDHDDVRLDVTAGVGATVARIKDRPGNFLLVAPTEKKAYEHNGPNRPLLRIGSPLPFNLSQLDQLLNGYYGKVYGHAYAAVQSSSPDAVIYKLDEPAEGTLEVGTNGLPIQWKTSAWKLQFRYENEQPYPDGLRLTGAGNRLANLLVKKREYPDQNFSPAQMALETEKGIQLLPLANYKP